MLKNYGYCPCCGKETLFSSNHTWLRDHYRCSKCGCIPRERALMSVIESFYPNWRELTIHESSPGNRGASLKLKNECNSYFPSQYWPNRKLGKSYDGFHNVNLEKKHFDAECFDLVITQDVFEHLYNPDKACKQIYRSLKKGGAHICTIPLVNKYKATEKCSIMEKNEITWLKEPEYHGNPINDKGSPVSFHYGYDLCFLIQKWSKFSCMMVLIDDLERGIRAEYNEVIIMRKE